VIERLRRRGFHALRVVPQPLLERVVRVSSPSYTLGGACRIEHDDQVLVLQTAYRRHWGLPGGLIDRNESPPTGVIREVREEVGLAVELLGEPIVLVDVAHRLVDFLYRGRLAAGVSPSDAHAASTEIELVKWIALADGINADGDMGRLAQKLKLFERMPDGGVYMVEPVRWGAR
jgi:8-oxo-dGTP pyrophosphatase MutT (NUDIX family)